jgi:hypothetical protein
MAYQIRGLRVLLGRLLQSSVRSPYPPIALVNESKNIRLVLHLEAMEYGFVRAGLLRRKIFGLETLGVWSRAGAKVHFLAESNDRLRARKLLIDIEAYRIGEKSMWAGTAQEVAAHFFIGPNQVGVGDAHSLGAHHLLHRSSVSEDKPSGLVCKYLEQLALHFS